jgi:hypothetical protein
MLLEGGHKKEAISWSTQVANEIDHAHRVTLAQLASVPLSLYVSSRFIIIFMSVSVTKVLFSFTELYGVGRVYVSNFVQE